jgi:hypothetical protein
LGLILIHDSDDNIVPVAQSEGFCDKFRTAGAGCELYMAARLTNPITAPTAAPIAYDLARFFF